MLLIHGENAWASFERYKILKSICLDKGFDIVSIEGDELNDISPLITNADSLDMFGNRKIILIKRLLSNKKTSIIKDISSFLKKLNQTNIEIVFWEDKFVPKNLIFYKLFLPKEIEEFKNLKKYEFEQWAKKTLTTNHIQLDIKQFNAYLEMTNYDQNFFSMELAKVKALSKSQNLNISSMLSDNKVLQIWGFIEELPYVFIKGSSQEKKELSELFSRLLNQQESEIKLHALIIRQVSLLIRTKLLLIENTPNNQIGVLLKIPPFKILDYVNSTSKFDLNDLVSLFERLLIWEQQIKTGISDNGFLIALFN